MADHGTEGRLPSRGELERGGALHLALAVQSHGGHQAVAERLGYESPTSCLFSAEVLLITERPSTNPHTLVCMVSCVSFRQVLSA
jgi:hypothetical protein